MAKKKDIIKKGVAAALQPGANLAAITTNLPDQAISVASACPTWGDTSWFHAPVLL